MPWNNNIQIIEYEIKLSSFVSLSQKQDVQINCIKIQMNLKISIEWLLYLNKCKILQRIQDHLKLYMRVRITKSLTIVTKMWADYYIDWKFYSKAWDLYSYLLKYSKHEGKVKELIESMIKLAKWYWLQSNHK